MTVHLIMVTYNSSPFLEACLLSLDGEDARVVLIDNSEDPEERARTARIAASHSARYLSAGGNIGFGAGVNRGVAAASPEATDWIWLLNPDTEVETGCLAKLIEAAGQQASSIVSPLITTGPERNQVWFAGGDQDLRRGRTVHRGYGRPVEGLSISTTECTFITGAAPLISASLWQALDGMREDLFLYWEDADFSERARAVGATLKVVPEARVWHRVGASGGEPSDGMSANYHYYLQRNRLILAAEMTDSWILPLFTTGREVVRSLAIAAIREKSSRMSKFRSSVQGVVDGLTYSRKQLASRGHR